MIDLEALTSRLQAVGLGRWAADLGPILAARLSPQSHGDFERWRDVLLALPAARGDRDAVRNLLLALAPWRKGPFEVDGIHIDAEWRSDLKWARLESALHPLAGRNVLDVGCGNGFYALQMRRAGADLVVGVDPTLLFVMQFLAINTFKRDDGIFVLPLRLEEAVPAEGVFDTTFSMGVLYHQRAPLEHLRQLRSTLRAGGQLVLETLYLPGDDAFARTPADRYARMRNVWLLPTVAELTTWLSRTGFRDIEIVDQSVTTVEEQRTTEWMPFESLAEALDPDDPSKTIEGWPAPHRVVVTATV